MSARAAVVGLLALLAVGSVAAGCGAGGQSERESGRRVPPPVRGVRPVSDRPNLVVVLADDLGWGDLGAYGQRRIRTPRLDRMALEGLRFRHFYSAAPICPPAREALLTGLHTGHTGVRRGGPLPRDRPTAPRYLPRYLARAGYNGGMFGKWGMGHYRPGEDGRPTATSGSCST